MTESLKEYIIYYYYKNEPKYLLRSSCKVIKSCAISSKLSLSVKCLCVCRRMQLFNLFSDIVALKYVKTRLKVEKFSLRC